MQVRGLLLVLTCFVLGISTGKPAQAAAFGDCAPIGTLENFEAGAPPTTRVFEAEDFRVVEGTESKKIEKRGKTCLQHYGLKNGAPRTTNLEIMRNYEEGLPSLGFRITNGNRSPDDDIYATLIKGGVEYWAHIWSSNGDGLHIKVLQVAAFQPIVNPALAAADCAPIRGLQDFITDRPPQTRTFAAEDFLTVESGDNKKVTKAGKTCRQDYGLKQGIPTKTGLDIMKNYAEALPQEGWIITNTKRNEDEEIFATRTKDGVEAWARVGESNGNVLSVLVLQIEPFKPTLNPAVTAADCAPIRGLQDFATDHPPEQKPYDSIDFRTVEDGQGKTITKTGKTCRQNYGLKHGIPTKTDLEIMKNYAGALPEEGWTVTNPKRDEADEIFATQNKDGVESWLHVWPANGTNLGVQLLQIAPFKSSLKAAETVEPPPPPPAPAPPPPAPAPAKLTLPEPGATPESVAPGQGDFPYLPSIPGSKLVEGRADASPFYVLPADAKQPELVANGSIIKAYQPPPGIGLAQLLGLYHTGLLDAHWTIVSELHAAGVNLTAHYGGNGRNLWATLHLAETGYSIRVADATIAQSKLAADLGSKCHLALTGVLFDFNKSTLKPESDAVLQQVAQLMARDPALRLEIQGHTDNIGTDSYNQPLSEARARAVLSWLMQHNVGPARLTARGYGKTRPIADNATDEGRAQNRRVEIANPACKM
jgi:outer membrane protein OmpA-like peptidoglycan-associated protein